MGERRAQWRRRRSAWARWAIFQTQPPGPRMLEAAKRGGACKHGKVSAVLSGGGGGAPGPAGLSSKPSHPRGMEQGTKATQNASRDGRCRPALRGAAEGLGPLGCLPRPSVPRSAKREEAEEAAKNAPRGGEWRFALWDWRRRAWACWAVSQAQPAQRQGTEGWQKRQPRTQAN